MAHRDPLASPNGLVLGTGVSLITHLLAALLVTLAISGVPGDRYDSGVDSSTPAHVTWLRERSEPRGGGGDEGEQRTRLRKPELARPEALSVAAEETTQAPDLAQEVQIPAVPITADVPDLRDIITGVVGVSIDAQGSGTSDRGGLGRGSGAGPGVGPGFGPGRDGGTGGEAYRPGGGVTGPRLIKETKPSYTADAMRARVQGNVILEVVVMPDGSVGRVRVVRSLDKTFGLDDAAIAAVKSWRFAPGTLAGRAVPVLVDIELTFTLR